MKILNNNKRNNNNKIIEIKRVKYWKYISL